jgi:hypothetical protein
MSIILSASQLRSHPDDSPSDSSDNTGSQSLRTTDTNTPNQRTDTDIDHHVFLSPSRYSVEDQYEGDDNQDRCPDEETRCEE